MQHLVCCGAIGIVKVQLMRTVVHSHRGCAPALLYNTLGALQDRLMLGVLDQAGQSLC